MNSTTRNIVIGLVVIAAAVGLVLFLTRRADAAVAASVPESPAPAPLPPKQGVINIGGVPTPVQAARMRPGAEQLFQRGRLGDPAAAPADPVPLARAATLKPEARALFKGGLR